MKKIKFSSILFLLVITLMGCKVKYPTSEKECTAEAKQIIKYIKGAEYQKLDKYVEKYDDYKKLTAEDLKKNYAPLENILKEINIDNLKETIRKDTIAIDYGASKDYIMNIYLTFFIPYKDKPDTEACTFTYSKEHGNNYYGLTYWTHSISVTPPRKITMPPGGVTPPPVPPK